MKGKRSGRWWLWTPTIVSLLGILPVAMLVYVDLLSQGHSMHHARADAVTDLRISAATSHLWLEESIANQVEETGKVWLDLAKAVRLAEALLDGGVTENELRLEPLKRPALRRLAEEIRRLLGEYEENAHERLATPEVAGVGSPLENRTDEIFLDLQQHAGELERILVEQQISEHVSSRRLVFGIFLAWAVFVVASTTGLVHRERRRMRAEAALQSARDELEQKVIDRTADLAKSNRQLREEIAERGRTEESLRESEKVLRGLSAQFRTLLDTIPDRISLISRDLKVIWANRDAASLSSAAAEDPASQHCHNFWLGASSACNGCPAVTSFRTGRVENGRLSTPDGRQWEIRAVPIARDNGTIEQVLEVATEVTEKVALMAETVRAGHLASIGELAAGVAHEINNPINGVINYARILLAKLDGASQEADLANRILKEGRRIADTLKALLLFARAGKREKTLVRVVEILSDSFGLIGSQLRKEGIQVQSAIPSDLPEITADPQEIQQVFMNIISNARYALNQKYPEWHDEKCIEIHAEQVVTAGNGSCVRIAFHDRGVGIPAGIIEKIREPFYSTKPRGEGTGLGLSISDGIIKEHGGKLLLESVEGESTTVVIELPAGERNHGQSSCHR